MGGRALDNNRRARQPGHEWKRPAKKMEAGVTERGEKRDESNTEGAGTEERGWKEREQEDEEVQRKRELSEKKIDWRCMLEPVCIQCYTTMLSNFISVNPPLLHILDISEMVYCSLFLLKSSLYPSRLSIQMWSVLLIESDELLCSFLCSVSSSSQSISPSQTFLLSLLLPTFSLLLTNFLTPFLEVRDSPLRQRCLEGRGDDVTYLRMALIRPGAAWLSSKEKSWSSLLSFFLSSLISCSGPPCQTLEYRCLF